MALVRARCYVWEIMAVGGHSTLSQVQVYIDEFNREQKAEDAMARSGYKQQSMVVATRQDSRLDDPNMQRLPPPRTADVGPTPRPVKSVIRHIVCVWPIMAVIGACDAIGASR